MPHDDQARFVEGFGIGAIGPAGAAKADAVAIVLRAPEGDLGLALTSADDVNTVIRQLDSARAPFHLKWSSNNSKLRKLKTVSFGLPALRSADGFVTCPGAGACAAVCFARQGWYRLPRVQGPREENLRAARGDLAVFVAAAVEDLERMERFRVVRVHDGGDFFSQGYLEAWFEIARRFPDRLFYAFTKSLHLDWTAKPTNFRLVQSEGGRWDGLIDHTKPVARIFADEDELLEDGFGDGHETDELAISGAPRIGLVYHGERRMTPAQHRALRRGRA